MDDERIRQLTEEVLGAIRGPGGTPGAQASLEERVAALERAVHRAAAPLATVAAVAVSQAHPSLRVLAVSSGVEGSCLLEPDKPCERSGMCRALGH